MPHRARTRSARVPQPGAAQRLYAGTSGFSYPEWKGTFYPEDLAGKAMLAHYASRLPCVEINNTFYRMPTGGVLTSWAEQVPPAFRFAIKASRRITHIKRLREIDDDIAYLYGQLAALGERLGPVLFQLPPSLRRDDELLGSLLARSTSRGRVTIEVRHPSWLDDVVFDLLRRSEAALCAVDAAEGELSVPLVHTASWGYVRLRRARYDAVDIRTWRRQLRAMPWQEAYVFFKHEQSGSGPTAALQLLAANESDG